MPATGTSRAGSSVANGTKAKLDAVHVRATVLDAQIARLEKELITARKERAHLGQDLARIERLLARYST